MPFANTLVRLNITYTEIEGAISAGSPAGSVTSDWDWWVPAGTTAAMQTAAQNLSNAQFINMRSGGKSIAFNSFTVVKTRPTSMFVK